MSLFFVLLAVWVGLALLNLYVMTKNRLFIAVGAVWLSFLLGPIYLILNLSDWDTVVWRRPEKKQ